MQFHGVYKNASTTVHPQVRICCLANQDFIEVDVTGPFYAKHVHQCMVYALNLCGVLGEGVAKVTVNNSIPI